MRRWPRHPNSTPYGFYVDSTKSVVYFRVGGMNGDDTVMSGDAMLRPLLRISTSRDGHRDLTDCKDPLPNRYSAFPQPETSRSHSTSQPKFPTFFSIVMFTLLLCTDLTVAQRTVQPQRPPTRRTPISQQSRQIAPRAIPFPFRQSSGPAAQSMANFRTPPKAHPHRRHAPVSRRPPPMHLGEVEVRSHPSTPKPPIGMSKQSPQMTKSTKPTPSPTKSRPPIPTKAKATIATKPTIQPPQTPFQHQNDPKAKSPKSKKPNILLILADDLGYADVDWHDNNDHTVYLRNSYVNQLCTPTRSSLMTGYYPFRTGTQNGVFLHMERSAVPLEYEFLPQKLKHYGYRNYLIGKWHLGYCRREFLPTARGFDYFYGYYGPQEGYFNHSTDMYDRNSHSLVRGLDFFTESEGRALPITDKDGVYSTHIFTEQTLKILDTHPKEDPFFLFLSYQSVHAPLQAPASYRDVCAQFRNDYKRLIYCAMLASMDESIGIVLDRLKQRGLYDDTVIIFSSDNGGDTQFGASNLPYRGEKNTIWEGGTKTVTFFHSKRHFNGFRYNDELFHVVDWHPTLLGMAGSTEMVYGDGINQWPLLANTDGPKLRRTQFIYNIDNAYSAIRKGDYKLIYETKDIRRDTTGRARLFRLSVDPYERNDIARQNPAIVGDLLKRLQHFAQKSRRSVRTPLDERGNPQRHGNVYAGNWC